MILGARVSRQSFSKMRKQGPCFHCGVARTPLWRNGPPEKPVLCNACGSRYRIGKTLENYTPKSYVQKKRKHEYEKDSFYSPALEDYYASSESSTPQYNNHHIHRLRRVKQEIVDDDDDHRLPHVKQDIVDLDDDDDDLRLRRVKQETVEDDDYEIPVENWGSFWEGPARKRSMGSSVVKNNNNKLTTIQKLRLDLHNILRNENPFKNGTEDDVLIYNVNINYNQNTEICHYGTVLLKFPEPADTSQQEIKPARSSSIPGKVNSPLSGHLQLQTASPPLENGGSEDAHSVQNENSSKLYYGDDHDHGIGGSPTM